MSHPSSKYRAEFHGQRLGESEIHVIMAFRPIGLTGGCENKNFKNVDRYINKN